MATDSIISSLLMVWTYKSIKYKKTMHNIIVKATLFILDNIPTQAGALVKATHSLISAT